MTKRKGKPVSFDAMVKFFMNNYNIPTKRDIENLNRRLDRLEKLIRTMPSGNRRTGTRNAGKIPQNATDRVLEIIADSPGGIGIAQLREQTGYDDKKLRNIIFRLNKTEKITRIDRGRYKATE